ncbi:SIR2 family protein [Jeongeupia sp. USM3]|uniref:SIR2 family protein n=1 Tax=Jeongeupia sp. USM3 TaxID=1906741 RepID=UPI0009F38C86|nr:SIR2 family protein [Jeongeupia sp. USM3]
MNIFYFNESKAKELLVSNYRHSQLIPFFGTGLTKGEKAKRGTVPDGKMLLDELRREIKKSKNISESDKDSILSNTRSLKGIFDFFEDDDVIDGCARRNYLINTFCGVKINSVKRQLLNLDWPSIVSLNIDDAIESATDGYHLITPNKKISLERVKSSKCIIKLHGCANEYAHYEDTKIIFTWRSYADSIHTNKSLLHYIQAIAESTAFVFIGCSLDEELDLMQIPQPMVFSKSIFIKKGKPDFAEKKI